MRSTSRRKNGETVTAAFFNIGDPITYGKYQNKPGKIVKFKDDGKGNPLVEIEPVPKGKKKNKTIALFKIRHPKKSEKKTAAHVTTRYLAARYGSDTVV